MIDRVEDRVESRIKGFLRGLYRVPTLFTGDRPIQDACVYFPGRVINKPDPCIYSQPLLMKLGLPVTWDNPDCTISLGGVAQSSHDLAVDTTYDVTLTVHNSSSDKKAAGTQVEARWMKFGIGGGTRYAIATTRVDVPTWPGVVETVIRWTTPSTPGHYCLEFELFHPQDGMPANNVGQHNTVVKTAKSTVEITVPIHDVHGARREDTGRPNLASAGNSAGDQHPDVSRGRVNLVLDSYVFADAVGVDTDPYLMFRPRGAAWNAHVEPAVFSFDAGETMREVRLIIEAPTGPGPAEVFNLTGWQDGEPMGGITVLVNRS